MKVCWYFPLKEQLHELLMLPVFRNLLMYESTRTRNEALMSDVYDTPRWRERMGQCTDQLTRIGVQYCVDGIPARQKKDSETVKPLQLSISSLPPWLRFQSRFMLIQMLIPAHLKGVLPALI